MKNLNVSKISWFVTGIILLSTSILSSHCLAGISIGPIVGPLSLDSGWPPQGEGSPCWSPDGTKIAFRWGDGYTAWDPSLGTPNPDGSYIVIMTADGQPIRPPRNPKNPLVNDIGWDNGSPDWSPDGNWIVYHGTRVGPAYISRVSLIDGTVVPITGTPSDPHQGESSWHPRRPKWSPDGTKIAYQGGDYWTTPGARPHHVWLTDPDGSTHEDLTSGITTGYGVHGHSWSPDGTQILFTQEGELGLLVLDVATKNVTPLPGFPSALTPSIPVWVSQNLILFVAGEVIYCYQIDTQTTTQLTYGPGDSLGDWHPTAGLVFSSSRGCTVRWDRNIYTANPLLEPGLLAYWKFDEGIGFIAGDSSGNGKDGIIDGATWTTGKIGNALNFDGSNDWVDVPDDISPEHITLEAWIYPTSFDALSGQVNPIITKETGRGTPPWSESFAWRIYTTPDAHLQFQVFTNTGGAGTRSTMVLQANAWYHVAGTYDGETAKLYVNGTLEDSSISSSPGPLVTTSLPTAIGHLQNWSVQWFEGIIDEVRVYGRALTSEEIAEHAERVPVEIWGVVTDDTTLEPVEGATVLIMDNLGYFKKDTTTDAAGYYVLSDLGELTEDLFPCYLKVLAEDYGHKTCKVEYNEVQAGSEANFALTPATILHVPYYNQGFTGWCGPASAAMALKKAGFSFKPWEIAAQYSLGVGDGFIYLSYIFDDWYDLYENKIGIDCNEKHWATSTLEWPVKIEPLTDMLEYVKTEIDEGRPIGIVLPDLSHAVAIVGYDQDNNLYINDPSGALVFDALGYPKELPRSLVAERVTWEELCDKVLSKAVNRTYVGIIPTDVNQVVSCYVRNDSPGASVMPPPNRYPDQYSNQLYFENMSDPSNQLALRLDGTSKLGYRYYSVFGNHPELAHSSLGYLAVPGDFLWFSPCISNSLQYNLDVKVHLWIGQILPNGDELVTPGFGFRKKTLTLNPHISFRDDQKDLLHGHIPGKPWGMAFPLSLLEPGYDYCLHLEVFLSSESAEPADELSFRFHLLDQVVVSPEGGTVALPDGDTNPENDTRIEMPAGALHEDTVISITKVDAAPVADFSVGLSPVNPIAAYEVAARNEEGEEILVNFLTSATLYLAYPDADDDGYVDGISPPLLESWLNVWSWDPVLYQWALIPSDVDEVNNVVWLYTNHLSTYSLFPNTIAIKNSAIAELEGAKIGDKIDKDIDDAIKHIKKSLDKKQDFWIDDSHLDPKHGKKVFDEEKKAARILMQLMDNKDVPEAVKDVCLIAIAKLIEADDILASTIYDEALDVAGDPKVDKELEKCEKEFEKVDEELAKENYDKAIDHYKKAWEHAQKALKKLW